MTIDERLEALTHTAELHQLEMGKFDEAMKKLAESQAKTEKMVRAMGRFAMAIGSDHERRLFALEHPEDEAH
jgi:hypothetical protein